MTVTPEELRRRADELEELRRRGIAAAGFAPHDDGKLLGTMGGAGRAEFRITWSTPVDRTPQMRVRLWVDEGTGLYPKRGVGFDVPAFRMAEFARAVAEGLEYAIEHQKAQTARPHRNGDARLR